MKSQSCVSMEQGILDVTLAGDIRISYEGKASFYASNKISIKYKIILPNYKILNNVNSRVIIYRINKLKI
jgi:hypothetical protein